MKLVHPVVPVSLTGPTTGWDSLPGRDPAPHGRDAVMAAAALSARENRENRDLESRVYQSLGESGYFQLRSVACFCEHKTAFLSGQIPSFYLKQTAQEIVRRIEGIEHIQNRLEVVVSN